MECINMYFTTTSLNVQNFSKRKDESCKISLTVYNIIYLWAEAKRGKMLV